MFYNFCLLAFVSSILARRCVFLVLVFLFFLCSLALKEGPSGETLSFSGAEIKSSFILITKTKSRGLLLSNPYFQPVKKLIWRKLSRPGVLGSRISQLACSHCAIRIDNWCNRQNILVKLLRRAPRRRIGRWLKISAPIIRKPGFKI